MTLSKRRPAFDLIKREDCKWNNKGDSDKPYLKYPGQYRVGPITKCQIQDGCEGSIAISYSETVSESFGMSAGAGATLFEVISLSMEFSYSQETAEQNQFTYTHSYSVPYGASGYVAWEPVTECKSRDSVHTHRSWQLTRFLFSVTRCQRQFQRRLRRVGH